MCVAITIGIEDDTLPENDEVIVIELYNAEGGAVLDVPQHSQATVLIMANDYVAGLLAFERSSYLVREGIDLNKRLACYTCHFFLVNQLNAIDKKVLCFCAFIIMMLD